MGRFAESNPLLDAVVDVIADRAEDFDREVIEDLIQAVGEDDIWLACVGPAINAIMDRIGLSQFIESSEERGKAVHKEIEDAGQQALAQAQGEGKIALVNCECPHCNHSFFTTLESIVNRESDKCPNCEKQIVPELVPGEEGTIPEPPTEGGP